jgi:FKBP-type peptidyl-prolyl cis-trans isomerase
MKTIAKCVIICLISKVISNDENEVLPELKVEVLSKPEECDRQTAKGDMLTMHYRGTLEDGTEFDSRFISLLSIIFSLINKYLTNT